jgi:hypothetical protein
MEGVSLWSMLHAKGLLQIRPADTRFVNVPLRKGFEMRVL